jgi:hypothetical protein
MVAGPGIEPGTGAYETPVLPLHYPALIFIITKQSIFTKPVWADLMK